MKCKYVSLIAGCFWLWSSGTLNAHDFWIEPDTFTPEEHEQVDISLRFGDSFKGDTLPYIDALFNDFSVSNESGRSAIQSILGNDPAATIIATAGAQLLGYQSEPQFVVVDADTFNRYIIDEGIEYIRAERDRRGQSDLPAPENFIRCAKALIQTGTANQSIYRQELGYTLELIPQSDPYQLEPGDELEFELLYQGEPIDSLQIQALRKNNPENVQKVRTDNNGKAAVIIDTAGIWMVKVVLILPVAERQQIVEGQLQPLWQSYWASYVFEVTES